MNRFVLWFSLAICLLSVSLAFAQTSFSSANAQVANFGDALNSENWTFHNWDRGHLVAVRHDSSPTEVSVVAYDSAGKEVRNGIVWFEKAEEVNLTSAVLAPGGSLLVSGGTHNKDLVIANFIAAIGDDRKVSKVVKTNPFVTSQICSSREGKIWALGWERGKSKTDSYALLREYSFDAGLLRTAIPRASTKLSIAGKYAGDTRLICSPDAVLLYQATSGELFRYDLKTDSLKVTTVQPVEASSVLSGLALDSQGKLFASFHRNGRPDGTPPDGLCELATSGSHPHWALIPNSSATTAADANTFGSLLGFDKEDVVFTRDRTSGVAFFGRLVEASH